MHIVYISQHKHKFDAEMKSLQYDYDLTDDGDLKDYLGTHFGRHSDGFIVLAQPCMIGQIFDILGLSQQMRTSNYTTHWSHQITSLIIIPLTGNL